MRTIPRTVENVVMTAATRLDRIAGQQEQLVRAHADAVAAVRHQLRASHSAEPPGLFDAWAGITTRLARGEVGPLAASPYQLAALTALTSRRQSHPLRLAEQHPRSA